MPDPVDMLARHSAALARIAEAAERLAMKHADRALATDDPDVEVRATAAFHRAARAMRQSIALEAKLVRDAQRAERDAQSDATRERSAHAARRREQLRTGVARLIWTEHEDDDAERLADDLDDLLEIEAFSDVFTTEPADAQIARLCAELGLTPPDTVATARRSSA